MASEATSATYTAPDSSHVFEQIPIATIGADVQSKKEYFTALRTSTKLLQHDINVFLTQKMEEDKAITNGASQHAIKDEEEEENYGEEKVEED